LWRQDCYKDRADVEQQQAEPDQSELATHARPVGVILPET
jgi:hypothetical protein